MRSPTGVSSPSGDSESRLEIERGDRFAFGENWAAFLRLINEDRIQAAQAALISMLGGIDLRGKRFLDVGSGSGLSSLVARRLGAQVLSFDYDPASVACTAELRRRYFPNDELWRVEQGSALDPEYLASLGQFDLVYSWGVLHHTGDMWRALDLVSKLVSPAGSLLIAIYNDQGAWSRRWTRIKRFYCRGPLQRILVAGTFIPFWILRGLVADVVWGRNPLKRYREYHAQGRGMSVLRDWHDWLGGYPFEVAKPEGILEFYRFRGFSLQKLTTAGGSVGCNEFLFGRDESQEMQERV